MRTMSRFIPLLGCAAGCALAGCCTTPRSTTNCTACVPTGVVMEMTPNYENFTPPAAVIRPIPLPDGAPPPPAESAETPPSPQAKSFPNGKVDYFEPASDRLTQ